MKTVAQILKSKGNEVYTIRPEAFIYEALQLMAEKGVGGLVVMSDKQVVGIFTERDHVRKVDIAGLCSHRALVSQVMSTEVCYITPQTTVDEGMALMTDNRCRHLPVVDDNQLVGLVSIGDLVKASLDEKEFVIEQLKRYIQDGQ
ncbi:MAG: CBS domain-containing protein [Deltaproteobacteria bacterium]|nr:CBS domain-containing protein [Deltaproteobacteria bacterium]MBW2477648.1 CBS domain-containing protein [Deltaproteobacteria bacterium]MBW2503088.1 CBS domain-containing protein [Deltaproteobacteria bacterium]MBW2519848.1 CBS domain-containing protein [Deltaproteobacteria bacterium]